MPGQSKMLYFPTPSKLDLLYTVIRISDNEGNDYRDEVKRRLVDYDNFDSEFEDFPESGNAIADDDSTEIHGKATSFQVAALRLIHQRMLQKLEQIDTEDELEVVDWSNERDGSLAQSLIEMSPWSSDFLSYHNDYSFAFMKIGVLPLQFDLEVGNYSTSHPLHINTPLTLPLRHQFCISNDIHFSGSFPCQLNGSVLTLEGHEKLAWLMVGLCKVMNSNFPSTEYIFSEDEEDASTANDSTDVEIGSDAEDREDLSSVSSVDEQEDIPETVVLGKEWGKPFKRSAEYLYDTFEDVEEEETSFSWRLFLFVKFLCLLLIMGLLSTSQAPGIQFPVRTPGNLDPSTREPCLLMRRRIAVSSRRRAFRVDVPFVQFIVNTILITVFVILLYFII